MWFAGKVCRPKRKTPNKGNTGISTKKTTAATKNASAKKPATKKSAATKTAAKKKVSQIDAALTVLKKSRKPLSCT